jgi:SAM-dependent methyltransferase
MKLSTQVTDILARSQIQGNTLRLSGQLDRATYVEVNKALLALGGKWNRKAAAHVFDGDPNDAVASAVATGEVTDWKKEFQFFETPPELADRMAELASGPNILEPSAGNGALLDAMKRAGLGNCHIFFCELNPKCCATVLAKHPEANFVGDDFLRMGSEFGVCPGFDTIIMNPPFNHGQDIAHVRHAFQFLKPGGRLIAITAPGWTFRQDRKHVEFRDWIETVHANVEDLPSGTFKSSGTMVSAKLLTIDKI